MATGVSTPAWLFGDFESDLFVGGTVNDTLVGGGGDDLLDGRGGDDPIYEHLTDNQSTGGVDDVLRGGQGSDVLVGDRLGGNELSGEGGSDVMIGGLFGGRSLDGGAGEDLIVVGQTDYDADRLALVAIRDEWKRTDRTAVERRAALASGVGADGAVRLTSATVDIGTCGTISGGGGYQTTDWFILNTVFDGADDAGDNDLINFS